MSGTRVVISGRVQGVFFRSWTVEEATKRRLSGWVRNRRDGTVEAVFAGEDVSVKDMVQACWKGPPYADVHQVETFAFLDEVEPGFRQARTA